MDMSVWYLVGAALVFFMQAGFAMVEAGFTRAKNAGNIIMKNLMDFCIGTAVFILFGYGIMNSSSHNGFLENPSTVCLQTLKGLIGLIFLPVSILCHMCYNSFWCYGRENKIQYVLYLFCNY